MPISNEYQRLALDLIRVARDERQRRKVEIDSIKGSIAARGVIEPIIVRREFDPDPAVKIAYWLVAGERRLEASRSLELPDIPVRFADELTTIEAKIIELEENLKRKDLHWTEMVQGVLEIHRLYCAGDVGWTYELTAGAIGLSRNIIIAQVRVAEAIEEEKKANAGESKTAECTGWSPAYERLTRLRQRASAEALSELLEDDAPTIGGVEDSEFAVGRGPVLGSGGLVSGPLIGIPAVRLSDPTPQQIPSNAAPRPRPEAILNEDFIEWSRDYAGPKFNLIHCDFPYGVGIDKGRGKETMQRMGFEYKDDIGTFDKLLDAFIANAKNFISGNAHLLFWCPAKLDRIAAIVKRFNEGLPQFEFVPSPLVWHKSDNSGQFPNPDIWPRHTYEVALMASTGGRKIVQQVADSISAKTNNAVHPSCKPLEVLGHFFRMLVDDSTRMLDPTCGSGTSVVMAERMGAKQVLGLELDRAMCNSARMGLVIDRKKRVEESARAKLPPTEIEL